MKIIENERYDVTLNPGHQIHLEEWVNSPYRRELDFQLKSGMALQCDIIAFPGAHYIGVHVEDTVVLADAQLRSNVAVDYPEVWGRIAARRNMLKNILGRNIGDDVLPLSNVQAVVQPFLLDPTCFVADASSTTARTL
jgi:hypothetical protein